MTSPVVAVTPETPLPDAADPSHKRLPVVDADGRLVGLVGQGGVLQVLSQEL